MKVLFINCYGGITSIRKVIAVLIKAFQSDLVTKPVVIRCLGNDSESVQEMLS